MHMHLVTNNTRARMVRQRPITDALAWHRAFETIAVTNLRLVFVWPRLWLTWLAR